MSLELNPTPVVIMPSAIYPGPEPLKSHQNEDFAAKARECVIANPIPSTLVAFAVGVGIGYLITSSKEKLSFEDHYIKQPYHAASDAISDTLATLLKNFKFWK